MELHRKLRPKTAAELVGQPEAAALLKVWEESPAKIPHAILLHGPTGCGKTTTARLIVKLLKCSKHDFKEINAADTRGIDTVREVHSIGRKKALGGRTRVFLFDEAHQLTKKQGGDAQTAMLKMLEEPPSHVYYLLATTDPEQLLPTIRGRCQSVQLSRLSSKDLLTLVGRSGGDKLSADVKELLTDAADGSARNALVLLEKLLLLKNEKAQLDAIVNADSKKQGFDLARCLISPRSKWSDAAKILKALADEPETVRHIVLAYAATVLLGGGPLAKRAYLLITAFQANFYESKRAGLVAACWEVLGGA
jgi:DNA polymerase III subunit gamma/tau